MFFISPPFGNYINLPGTISIKGSFTLEPRDGLLPQIFKTLRYSFKYQGWINKIGLRNKGIDYAIQNYNPDHIVSIAILNEEEIPKIIEKIPNDMNIELNVSCPNTEKEMVQTGLSRFINPERKWCIIKLSPLCDTKLIDNYYDQGFRQFHCSNTLPIKAIDENYKYDGGISGKSLISFTLNLVNYLNIKNEEVGRDITIIAGGGIRSWDNVMVYNSYGAKHFSASTVFFNPFMSIPLYYNYYNYYKFVEPNINKNINSSASNST